MLVCEMQDVRKSLGGVEIVSGVTLQVAAGEIVGIMGPSGSGKSTLLNIAGLLESPSSGLLNILGARAPRPNSRGAQRLLRHEVGYLFQNFALVDNASVDYNLKLAQRYSVSRSASARAAILAEVGLPTTMSSARVSTLSGGEQQRVAVARLLLKPCRLILADEPTGSLDPHNRDLVLRHLRRMADSGKAVMIVTHDPEVATACQRVIVLPQRERSMTAPEVASQ